MTDADFTESFAQCNNCGIIHRIIDFCKSEILESKEDLRVIPTIDDISLSLPNDLVRALNSSSVDLATFQLAQFLLEHEKWNSKIVLDKEEVDGFVTGKSLVFLAANKFRIEPFTYSTEIKHG